MKVVINAAMIYRVANMLSAASATMNDCALILSVAQEKEAVLTDALTAIESEVLRYQSLDRNGDDRFKNGVRASSDVVRQAIYKARARVKELDSDDDTPPQT